MWAKPAARRVIGRNPSLCSQVNTLPPSPAPRDLDDLTIPKSPLPQPHHPGVTHETPRDGDKVRVETRKDGRVFRAVIEYASGQHNQLQNVRRKGRVQPIANAEDFRVRNA